MSDLDLTERGHGLRNYSPEEFIEGYRRADTIDDRVMLRKALRRIDGGRWHDTLDEVHNHIGHSDLDSLDYLVSRDIYGDEMLQWVAAFGMVEDLSTFPELTGVEK